MMNAVETLRFKVNKWGGLSITTFTTAFLALAIHSVATGLSSGSSTRVSRWDTNWGDDLQALHQSPTDHQVIRLQRLGLELPNPPEVAES